MPAVHRGICRLCVVRANERSGYFQNNLPTLARKDRVLGQMASRFSADRQIPFFSAWSRWI